MAANYPSAMFPSNFGTIFLDVFGLLALATVVFGNPGVGLATGVLRGFDDIDYISKNVPDIDNVINFSSFGANQAGHRTRRVAEQPNFGGYPLPEYEPVEPKHESTAWSQMNPLKKHSIDTPFQSGHPGPENVDFFQRFATYYGAPDQQHGDRYEIIDPAEAHGIDEEEYIPEEGYEDEELVEGRYEPEEGFSKLVGAEEDSEPMKDEDARDRHEEEPPRPENIYLIEQQLEDLINQISSLYTLVRLNPYLAPVLTPYLHSNLPMPAPLYPPLRAAPVPLGKKLIHFSHGPRPVNYATHPVNYPAWPVNYPVGPVNDPVRPANYPISPINYRVPLVKYPVSPVNYQVRPVNYPVQPVNYQAKPVNMPQRQTIPLQLHFH